MKDSYSRTVPEIPTDPSFVVIREESRLGNRFLTVSHGELKKRLMYGTMHEIIRGKQKFYVDIDQVPINAPIYESLELDLLNPSVVYDQSTEIGTMSNNMYLGQTIEAIINVFEKEYDVKIEPNNLVVMANKYADHYSYHIVVDGFCFEDHYETRYIYERLLKHVDEEIHSSIDKTYKSLQNFRIEGSFKRKAVSPVKQANRRLNNYYHPIEGMLSQSRHFHYASSLVTIVEHCVLLPSKAARDFEITQSDFSDNKIMDICNEFLERHKMSPLDFKPEVTNKYIRYVYVRGGSRHCKFCKRTHSSDNIVFYASADKIVLHCRESKVLVWQRRIKPTIDLSSLSAVVVPPTTQRVKDTRQTASSVGTAKRPINRTINKYRLYDEFCSDPPQISTV